MKNIKRFENFKTFEEVSINDENFTVGKLIEELKKYDSNLPVRVGCHGYSNQEIVQIVEKGELEGDNEITILQINGNGSWDTWGDDGEHKDDEVNDDEDINLQDRNISSEDDEDESQYYPRRGRDTKKVSAFRKFFKS